MTLPRTSRRFSAPSMFAVLVVGVLALSGCSASTPETTAVDSTEAIFSDHGLDGLDVKQIITKLDAMPVAERPTNLIASVRPNELVLSDDQERTSTVSMPDDEFYVSFAPYLSQTHECYFHSLTTCRGELQNEEISVSVVDNETGETLIDETLRTFDNGFAGLWLPRGLDATLTVEYDGFVATSPLMTMSAEDPTCLTNLHLT